MQTRPKLVRISAARGFTLVEVLVVVVILGVLAAVVVPSFVSVARDIRKQVAEINQAQLQRGVVRYRQDHGEFPSVDGFHDQITLASNRKGDTAELGTVGFELGPYLLVIPTNPMTGGNRVGGGFPGSSDWLYDPATGQIKDNHFDPAEQDKVVRKMRTLLSAIRHYAKDNEGRLPGSFYDLTPRYMDKDQLSEAMRHPLTGEMPGYALAHGGELLSGLPLSRTAVLYELRNGCVWLGGATGFADGHVADGSVGG